MTWIARNESELLVVAAFLAAFVAIYSSWKAATSARDDRRGQMRERWVADFRIAMSEWLALMENPIKLQANEALRFYHIEHALELSFDLSDKTIDELRDAMQDLRFYKTKEGEESNAFTARSRVRAISRRIIQSEWQKAREGK